MVTGTLRFHLRSIYISDKGTKNGLLPRRADRQLQHNRSHSVQQDFSDEIRKHRQSLGEHNNNASNHRLDVNNVIHHVNDDVSERIQPNDENPPTRNDISSRDDADTSFMD
ncbi:hypothetical protein DPMN_015225 [Dreissena polymorpha]|uniref:Uncharacterized protein n=1 Tax=Dreissena polymorpha TaxID=45954 RepID=A0A9D4S485_DREPO|nr:hypothetical protein DPMN_015225 [Dreissena polymorpha]